MTELVEEPLWSKVELTNQDQEVFETHIVPNESMANRMCHLVNLTHCWCEPEILSRMDDGSVLIAHRIRH